VVILLHVVSSHFTPDESTGLVLVTGAAILLSIYSPPPRAYCCVRKNCRAISFHSELLQQQVRPVYRATLPAPYCLFYNLITLLEYAFLSYMALLKQMNTEKYNDLNT